MSAANTVQVGGTHYQSKMQHWDMVRDLGLDYFQGNITKYLTRHRAKYGKQDLEKAHHYARKAMELPSDSHPLTRLEEVYLEEYFRENKVYAQEAEIILLVVRRRFYDAVKLLDRML